jgi:hypothetical protein
MFKGLAEGAYLRKDIRVPYAPPLIRFWREPWILNFRVIPLLDRVYHFSLISIVLGVLGQGECNLLILGGESLRGVEDEGEGLPSPTFSIYLNFLPNKRCQRG